MLACSGGGLSGSRRIAGGHPSSGEDCLVDNGDASVAAYAGATTGHTTRVGDARALPDPALMKGPNMARGGE